MDEELNDLQFVIQDNGEINAENTEENKTQTVKITGVAYSGDEIRQWGNRVVVNLDRMKFSPQIPLMDTHENSTDAKLGEVTAEVRNNRLFISGAITSQSEKARQIVAEGKLSNWQLSIGATVTAQKYVEEGQSATVNGRTFKGPIYVAEQSLLREVSVVAIGADKGTSMKIAASMDLAELQIFSSEPKDTEKKMNPEDSKKIQDQTPDINASATQTLTEEDIKAAAAKASEDALVAERKRIADITAACNGEFDDIQAKAIGEGWDLAKTNEEVLKSIRASRPQVGINVKSESNPIAQNEIEAALCLRLGIDEDILAKSGMDEKTIEAGSRIGDISLKEVARECLRMSGMQPSSRVGYSESDIRASFSTVSLPGILGNVANKVMLKAYSAVTPVAPLLCSKGNLVDFKESQRYRLTDIGDLEPVAQDGEIKSGTLTEEGAKNKLDTYAKSFCLTRQMIINDDLGAFADVPRMMGNRSAKLVDKLFFNRLLANPMQEDGKTLFHADHRNLNTSAPFSKDALMAAITAFENQVDADGTPIAVSPSYLVVPTSKKFEAQELIHSALMITGENATKPAYNILADQNLKIVASPYLVGNDWYLFGNPNEVETFEIAYLKGKSTPTIQQGETDFNTLGMWFRVYFDLGIRELGFRGVQKNAAA